MISYRLKLFSELADKRVASLHKETLQDAALRCKVMT